MIVFAHLQLFSLFAARYQILVRFSIHCVLDVIFWRTRPSPRCALHSAASLRIFLCISFLIQRFRILHYLLTFSLVWGIVDVKENFIYNSVQHKFEFEKIKLQYKKYFKTSLALVLCGEFRLLGSRKYRVKTLPSSCGRPWTTFPPSTEMTFEPIEV